jgi:hypothetical protein
VAATNTRFAGLMTAVICICSMIAPARAEPAKIAASVQRQGDVVAFCKAHQNVDFPNRLFFGGGYRLGAIPRQISGLEDALQWRCMDGRVLVCSDSADGDWCSKKDASRIPSALLRQACREEPNKTSFSFAEGHYSAFDWRCKEGVPVIFQRYVLDRRDFFKTSWTPLIVRRGIVIGPTDFPAGPR